MDNLSAYYEYHKRSSEIRDIDPANDTLRYIANRFELNTEQRYWLSFLYASTYSATSAYYIYNEFPDFENVDVTRLQRWWNAKKHLVIFQTDRRRVKSSNQFVQSFVSYRELIGERTQQEFFEGLVCNSKDKTYEDVYKAGEQIYTFGRFTLFIYLEMLYVLTDLPLEPTTLVLKDAESCRNGIALAFGLTELNTHRNDKKLTNDEMNLLQDKFLVIKNTIGGMPIEHTNIWNIETTLCAYKKWRMNKRYVGYYIDRSGLEIEQMSQAIRDGVDWTPLWQFRKETYNHNLLKELNDRNK